jgi:glycosyltransferase involved in cell wall biosynthesis
MRIQVLVAAMNQKDHSLLQKMNIQSDVIVGNQCDRNSIEEFEYNGHSATYLNFAERGVGLNRNNALMRATGDICLFADDDMVYVDNYCSAVQDAFNQLSDADVIAFNLKEKKTKRYVIEKVEKVSYFNYLRYGTARVAVKLGSIRENGIYFNQCFGGGTEHCHGEDNIFLTDCLKAGLKIYAIPVTIAELTEERMSTWNSGYDLKYIQDQGHLYKAISKKFWKVLCLQDCIRRCRRDYGTSFVKSYRIMTGKEGERNGRL